MKTVPLVHNCLMREIGQTIQAVKERVAGLVGVPVLIKISSGRGKSELRRGEVSAIYPAVFSVALDTGEQKTFSYADVHTRNVMFLNPPENN